MTGSCYKTHKIEHCLAKIWTLTKKNGKINTQWILKELISR